MSRAPFLSVIVDGWRCETYSAVVLPQPWSGGIIPSTHPVLGWASFRDDDEPCVIEDCIFTDFEGRPVSYTYQWKRDAEPTPVIQGSVACGPLLHVLDGTCEPASKPKRNRREEPKPLPGFDIR